MKPRIDEQLQGLWSLYQAGAFLRLANADKSLIGKLKGFEYETDGAGQMIIEPDENGVQRVRGEAKEKARSYWGEINAHVNKGGQVLYYGPGRQGLMILDFDPLLEERVDAISEILGAPPYRTFHSSGRLKPEEGSRPAGYGGHALWRITAEKAEEAAKIRRFSNEHDGDHYGEAFTGHPGFGVIVWNAPALVETIELDEIEAVDPTLLPIAKYSLASKDENGEWMAGEGSRHDAAWSSICSAAIRCKSKGDFEYRLNEIYMKFVGSFSDPVELGKRLQAGEWDRLSTSGWERWKQDRENERITPQQIGEYSNRLQSMIKQYQQRGNSK